MIDFLIGLSVVGGVGGAIVLCIDRSVEGLWYFDYHRREHRRSERLLARQELKEKTLSNYGRMRNYHEK